MIRFRATRTASKKNLGANDKVWREYTAFEVLWRKLRSSSSADRRRRHPRNGCNTRSPGSSEQLIWERGVGGTVPSSGDGVMAMYGSLFAGRNNVRPREAFTQTYTQYVERRSLSVVHAHITLFIILHFHGWSDLLRSSPRDHFTLISMECDVISFMNARTCVVPVP